MATTFTLYRVMPSYAVLMMQSGFYDEMDSAARDQLWIRNPFMTRMRWHYSLPEAVRIQAVHVRHHATQIDELARP